MPTVPQLPPATAVNATDELMLAQSGTSVSATVAQLFSAGSSALTLTGDVSGSGTGTIVTTITPVTSPGTFSKVSVNAKGQVTSGASIAAADVVNALGYSPYNNSNPSGFVSASQLAPVATSGTYSSLTGAPTLGSIAAQNANAVAITGGTLGGVDLSDSPVTATGSTTARELGARAGDWINVLDFGADPTGAADSASAFVAAMNAVPSGGWGKLLVPKGNYTLGSFVNQPSGRSIAVVFQEGAITSGGGLGVDRVESNQGAYSLRQNGGGWFSFSPSVGSSANSAFHNDILQNTSSNSAAMRVGWNKNYSNYNYYGKYVAGIDIAEQSIFSWPYIYDNSSGWGHWEVINGTTWDEDSGARAHISSSAEHSEFDVANNGPESGWTFRSGVGLPVQGMSIDPWGQNGNYGGNILYAYGSVGSYDGQTGGLNQRWPSYPAVFSAGNPAAVAQDSTIVITFDLAAHGTATLSSGGGVSGASISSGGGAYTSAPTVAFSGGEGSGAAATPVMLGGSVVGVTITSPGSGYTSAPTVTFTAGGVASPSPITVTLNADGAHGDLLSVANAINAADIANVHASVSTWGGVVSRLVVYGTATSDLGTLTLGGTALSTLGINPGGYATTRDVNVVVFGGTGSASPGDKLTINNATVTIAGAGAQSDVVNAINNANIIGVRADINANGVLVLIAWVPQNPGGLVLSEPAGYTTLAKLGLNAGTFWPPTPPKGFATAYGELSSPICPTSDQIAISATDLSGNTYGPVTVTLNGGAGTGSPTDVLDSFLQALTGAGWLNTGSSAMLSAAPAIVSVLLRGATGNLGVALRNTAGGTLTLANVTGTPLQTLGITPGTYQPGGYSAGSQSVFMAAEDSIAPQGRGIFLGGASNATDPTVWPHAPLEARGGFLHGLRTDKATFNDNNAVLVGISQAISFGTGTGSLALTNADGSLEVNGAVVALSTSVPTHTSQLTNDTNFIASNAIPTGAGTLLGGTATAGVATTIALGSNLTLASGTLSAVGVTSFNGRSGVVSLSSADVAGALGYTPGSSTGTVSSVVAGAGLAGGTINVSGTLSLGAIAASSLMGNAGGSAAVPGAIAVGQGVALSSGTLTNSGVVSFAGRTGAVALGSADVAGALGYTPASVNGAAFSGGVTLDAGGVLAGTLTNSGTISGGTLAGTVTASGTLDITGSAIGQTQTAGNNSTNLATTAYVYAATANAATVTTTGGSTTLTAAQYGVPVIIASGALTSNATFVVPNNGVWKVANRTSGAFTLTVTTAPGAGVMIDQGYSATVFADGTNVVFATTDFNGIILQGSVVNDGTISGGTLAPAALVVGTAGSMVTVTQTIDASGYHPVMLKTTGTNTNVPFVFAPAGTGYIATALSDGSAANGNQRGVYAVDLQQKRAANTQVASGSYAAVPGGSGNTAGGSYSFAAGQGSTATGQGSVALGQYANDGGAYGKLVFSSNALTTGNQLGITTLYVSSVSAATRMTSDGNAAGTENSIPIRANHVIAGTLTVTARNVSSGDGALWSIPVLFKNSAGTVSVTNPGTSTVSPTVADSSLIGATISIAADNTNQALSVTITPPTSVTLSASATFLATEM